MVKKQLTKAQLDALKKGRDRLKRKRKLKKKKKVFYKKKTQN